MIELSNTIVRAKSYCPEINITYENIHLKRGDWIHGYLWYMPKNTAKTVIYAYIKPPDAPLQDIAVFPNTVQRYTGKDNLYEGDLITIGKDTTVYCIVWDIKYLGWMYVAASDKARKFPFTSSDFDNGIKVVGNILDNPELWNKNN